MSSQRYQRVSAVDDSLHDDDSPSVAQSQDPTQQSFPIHASPPPSFRSRDSSRTRRRSSDEQDPLFADADTTLADAFDAPSDSEDDDQPQSHQLDERQRVMSGRPSAGSTNDENSTPDDGRPAVERRITQLPVFPPPTSARVRGGGNVVHDGVFANLSAKPEHGDDVDEKPPSYEQAAADATPPYWENTILAPGGTGSDEVYIDGLPVGSLFSFIWNGMISMSFQLVGFLLTYLLHTTHAAKNGSKAGLGITLVHYGFSMKGSSASSDPSNTPGGAGEDSPLTNNDGQWIAPSNPNNHNFNSHAPNNPGTTFIPTPSNLHSAKGSAHSGGVGGLQASDWFAYGLMIVGWFVLIRAISEYLKARKHEAMVMQTPSRGLATAVVAEDEDPERSV